ncbi:MAG: hypothetical protein WAM44_12825 [Chthoniobacterales bacterium]
MSTLDNATTSRTESKRTRVDVIACVASLVDALACLIFLLWQTKLTNVGRSYIECIIDPITCLIGYWGFYRRLHDTEAILADIGLAFLVLGTVFLTCQNAVEDLANPNFFWLQGDTPKEADFFLELLVVFILPIGLAIYAWLIGSSPSLRRWMGFMIGVQVLLFFIYMGTFRLPLLTVFVSSQLFTGYAIILSTAKAIWFLSPQRGSR